MVQRMECESDDYLFHEEKKQMPVENERMIGKYHVKESFAGEESLTSLLTQYVERTVKLHCSGGM